jgi:hypothetical protein
MKDKYRPAGIGDGLCFVVKDAGRPPVLPPSEVKRTSPFDRAAAANDPEGHQYRLPSLEAELVGRPVTRIAASGSLP